MVTLPEAAMSAAVATHLPDKTAGRRMLLLLTAVLALPFVLAAVLIFSGWQPPTAPHAGELATQHIQAGKAFRRTGRWLLVMRAPTTCAAECLARLDVLRRLHVALYKAQPRVRRVLLAAESPTINQPDLTVAAATGWQRLAGAGVWLVDPRGHAVLRYDTTTLDSQPATHAMLKDIERLLRYSWTG
jgi:hypothetical protein